MFNKNNNQIKWDFSCFVLGILSFLMLYFLSLLFNEQFNTLLMPDIYVLYIPIIYGIIVQTISRNLLSETICPNIYFEKGILFSFIMHFISKIFFPIIFTINIYGFKSLDKNLIAYNFILHISPLLAYLFISWIYYFIQDLRVKYYTQKYIALRENKESMLDDVIDNNEEKLNEESFEEVPESKDEEEGPVLLNFLERITKMVSKKVEENIEKQNDNKK